VKVTLCPTPIVTWDGLTAPFEPIVIVAPTVPTAPVDPTTTEPPPPPPPGEVGELPPHADAVRSNPMASV
jgi:hypothetical protein